MRSTYALAALLLAAGCNPTPSRAPAPRGHVELLPADVSGDVQPMVLRELARARKDGKRLLVYEGAGWCEPCRRFHAAAQAGHLDANLPTLRLLEFDADRDNERLAVAGYASQFIPMFALPKADGTFSGRMSEGASVHGDGAVGELVAKLRPLLAP